MTEFTVIHYSQNILNNIINTKQVLNIPRKHKVL